MTDQEIIEELGKVSGVFEAYKVVSRFTLHRHAGENKVQTITVEVLDAGSAVRTDMRYHVFAQSDDGRTAGGNPDSTIEAALDNVHWEHLDYPV